MHQRMERPTGRISTYSCATYAPNIVTASSLNTTEATTLRSNSLPHRIDILTLCPCRRVSHLPSPRSATLALSSLVVTGLKTLSICKATYTVPRRLEVVEVALVYHTVPPLPRTGYKTIRPLRLGRLSPGLAMIIQQVYPATSAMLLPEMIPHTTARIMTLLQRATNGWIFL